MRLIEPSVTRVEETGIKLVELAARNCFQSVPKPEGNTKEFVLALAKSNHFAPLEFAKYWSERKSDFDGRVYDLRHILERRDSEEYSDLIDKLESLEHASEEYPCFKITTSLQVANELVRHRRFSFCQESTRYCNYSKEKFGGLTFVLPPTLDKGKKMYLVDSLALEERIYLDAIEDHHYTAQEAAMFLPKQTATTIYMQGHKTDWIYFLDLRYFEITGKVLPEMKHIATLIKEQL